MKILIIDSDRDLVEMLNGWLKTLGYDVHRAYSGESAKRAWEEQQPASNPVLMIICVNRFSLDNC